MTKAKHDLIVCEYDGDPRSGKGTIVRYLADLYRGVLTDETGAGYRFLTKCLLEEGIISLTMTSDQVKQAVSRVKTEVLVRFMREREQRMALYGFKSLYQPIIHERVYLVGQFKHVRDVVKAGLKHSLALARDDDQVQVMLIDGRKLGLVVADVPDITLGLRTFFGCEADEAARRECLRSGVATGSAEFIQVETAIRERKAADAARLIDPVRADDDAIDYWSMGGQQDISRLHPDVGTLAVSTGRQIYFDTTPFRDYPTPDCTLSSLDAMCLAGRMMFEEAMAEFGVELKPR